MTAYIKTYETPPRSSTTLPTPASFRAPASPSSLGTCICGWMAASGQVAERWRCPCYQGELPSCHHRMPLDGSSALASPAGVWKRKEKRDLQCLQTLLIKCLAPSQNLLSQLAKEPWVPQLHRLIQERSWSVRSNTSFQCSQRTPGRTEADSKLMYP